MKTTASKFATAALVIALVGTAATLTMTSAEAGPRFSSGTKSVSSMDLGSGR